MDSAAKIGKRSAVTAISPAPSGVAREHFAAEFTFETDCSDVHDALSKGADFVLLDVRSPALLRKVTYRARSICRTGRSSRQRWRSGRRIRFS